VGHVLGKRHKLFLAFRGVADELGEEVQTFGCDANFEHNLCCLLKSTAKLQKNIDIDNNLCLFLVGVTIY